MTTQIPDSQLAGSPAPEPERPPPRPRRRGRIIGGTVVVLALAASGAYVVIEKSFADDPAPSSARPTVGTSLATVRKGSLSTQINQDGTLAYVAQADGTPYSLVNRLSGIYTMLPEAGDTVSCGHVVYRVDGEPVVLLCGNTPFYRNLSRGDDGHDVRQLNKSLVSLGYVKASKVDDDWDYFGWRTEDALEDLQDDLNVDQSGELDLGAAVVAPHALRITKTTAQPGTNAMPGSPVASASTLGRQVTVDLNAAQQSQVKVGDQAVVTLPNNKTVAGKVSRIGTVANSSGNDSDTTTTIPVYITLTSTKGVGHLDQAPVQVQIRVAGVNNVLIVPVTALVGQGDGGFAVEKVDALGAHTVVPVDLGLFDNADGLVQVSGNLAEGDHVVVPSS